MMRKLSLFVLLTSLLGISLSVPATAQEQIDGYWEGVIAQQGNELRFNVEFKRQADGITAIIDIPDLYILGYKLTGVTYDAPKVHFELPLGQESEKFDGTLQDRNISGNYTGRFYQEEPRSAVIRLWRETRKTTPYKQEEVNFYNGPGKFSRGTCRAPTLAHMAANDPARLIASIS